MQVTDKQQPKSHSKPPRAHKQKRGDLQRVYLRKMRIPEARPVKYPENSQEKPQSNSLTITIDDHKTLFSAAAQMQLLPFAIVILLHTRIETEQH